MADGRYFEVEQGRIWGDWDGREWKMVFGKYYELRFWRDNRYGIFSLQVFINFFGRYWWLLEIYWKIIKIHSYRNRHLICCHWSNVKENNKKNEIVSRIENNNYISSRNQTQPESGMNPFSPKTNSFLDRTFYYYIFTFIQEGIRLWREGIHPRFWLGLIPRTNIITIF